MSKTLQIIEPLAPLLYIEPLALQLIVISPCAAASWELLPKIPWLVGFDSMVCSPPANETVFAGGGLEKTFLPFPLTFLKASTCARWSAACLVKDCPNSSGAAARRSGSSSSAKETNSLLYSSRIFVLLYIENCVAALPRKATADCTESSTTWKSRLCSSSPLSLPIFSNRSVRGPTASNINACRRARDWSVDLTAGRHSAAMTLSSFGAMDIGRSGTKNWRRNARRSGFFRGVKAF